MGGIFNLTTAGSTATEKDKWILGGSIVGCLAWYVAHFFLMKRKYCRRNIGFEEVHRWMALMGLTVYSTAVLLYICLLSSSFINGASADNSDDQKNFIWLTLAVHISGLVSVSVSFSAHRRSYEGDPELQERMMNGNREYVDGNLSHSRGCKCC